MPSPAQPRAPLCPHCVGQGPGNLGVSPALSWLPVLVAVAAVWLTHPQQRQQHRGLSAFFPLPFRLRHQHPLLGSPLPDAHPRGGDLRERGLTAPALSLLAGVPPQPSFLGDVALTPLRSIPAVAPALSPSRPRCRGPGWSPAPHPTPPAPPGPCGDLIVLLRVCTVPPLPPRPPRGGCTIPSALPPGLGGKDAGKGQEEAAGTDVRAALRPKDEVPGASSPPALLPLPCTSPEPPRPPALMG